MNKRYSTLGEITKILLWILAIPIGIMLALGDIAKKQK